MISPLFPLDMSIDLGAWPKLTSERSSLCSDLYEPMDPNAARQLVEDDAYSSRGINYNPITSAAEERLLFDAERQDGDDRDRERDDEDDGMAWEPSRSPLGRPRHSVDSSNAGARHSQGSFAQLERDNADLNSPPAYHHRHQRHASHHDDTTLTSLDKRKIRVMWWRAAAINCIFIAAWYTFSTCISVYSQYTRGVLAQLAGLVH